MESIRLGDEGTTLRATIYDQDGVIVDLSLAIAIEFRIRKPNGTHLSKIASFFTNGTDGKMQYSFGVDEIDHIGRWQITAYVEFSNGSWYSTNGEFMVNN